MDGWMDGWGCGKKEGNRKRVVIKSGNGKTKSGNEETKKWKWRKNRK